MGINETKSDILDIENIEDASKHIIGHFLDNLQSLSFQ